MAEDNLEIGIGVTGVNETLSNFQRIEQAALRSQETLNRSFIPDSRTTSVFSQKILAFQNQIITLERSYANLGKSGAKGFEDISKRQTETLSRLVEINAKLREFDIAASKPGVEKSVLTRLKTQITDLRKEVSFFERDLVPLQEKEILIKTRFIPSEDPIKTSTSSQIEAQILKRNQRALTLESGLQKFVGQDLNPEQKNRSQSANYQVKLLDTLIQKTDELKQKLRGTNDPTIISQVEKDLIDVDAKMDKVAGNLIKIKRNALRDPGLVASQKASKIVDIDADGLTSKLTQQNRAAIALEKQLLSLSRLKYSGSSEIVDGAKKALVTLEGLTTELKDVRRQIELKPSQSVLKTLELQAKELRVQIDAVSNETVRLNRLNLRAPHSVVDPINKKPGSISSFIDGLGIPGVNGTSVGIAGGMAALAYGAHKFIDVAEQAIDRASELTRSNRLLASSATEAGITYEDLAKKNRDFAISVGLSDVKATTTVAKVTQLATRTQRPEDIDKLLKGFANLGAARGLESNELETVIQQIITGQDEGYKKLLLPNPSQLYAQYAKDNNRTLSSISAVERSRIFESEFLKKAELFNGTAEARMQSLDGRAAKLNASMENLKNTISLGFASSYEVNSFMDVATRTLKSFNGEIDDLASKVKRGINIDELIKKNATPGFFGAAASDITAALGLVGGVVGSLVTGAKNSFALFGVDTSGPSIGASLYEPSASKIFGNDEVNREYFLRQQVNAQLLYESKLALTAQERRVEIARDNAKEEVNILKSVEEKKYDDIAKNSRSTVGDFEKAIQGIRNAASGRLAKPFDEAELNRRVDDSYKKADLSLYPGQTPAQVKEKLSTGLRAEMQGALDIINQPLFDEATEAKLIATQKEGLSQVLQKGYKAVLDDPKLRPDALFREIGKIKGDSRLFPEIQEQLLREADNLRESMAKKLEDVRKDFRGILISSSSEITNNPFVNLLSAVTFAADDTYKKLLPLGEEVAKFGAKAAEAAAQYKVTVATYEATDKGLTYRQEANKLANLPDTQTDAFARRLETQSSTLQYLSANRNLLNQAEEDRFYSDRYRPGGATFLQDKYGYGGSERFTRDFTGPSDQRQAYEDVSRKIEDLKTDLPGLQGTSTSQLGIYGKEAIARAVLDRLPTRAELLPRLDSYGQTKEDARQLLIERADASEILVQANKRRFRDLIANQQVLDQTRVDAEERVKNLGVNGAGLTNKDQLDKFLAITQELGTAELTPQLRQGRIRALTARAEIEESQRKAGAENLAAISSTMEFIKKQIEASGLKVTLAETPLVNLTINAKGVDAELNPARPNSRTGTNTGR